MEITLIALSVIVFITIIDSIFRSLIIAELKDYLKLERKYYQDLHKLNEEILDLATGLEECLIFIETYLGNIKRTKHDKDAYYFYGVWHNVIYHRNTNKFMVDTNPNEYNLNEIIDVMQNLGWIKGWISIG